MVVELTSCRVNIRRYEIFVSQIFISQGKNGVKMAYHRVLPRDQMPQPRDIPRGTYMPGGAGMFCRVQVDKSTFNSE